MAYGSTRPHIQRVDMLIPPALGEDSLDAIDAPRLVEVPAMT